MLSPGTFGHGGAYGTQAWIDPAKKRIYLLMVQRSNFPNSDASEVRREFQEAAASALESARVSQAAPARLIVRGDDMGFSHAGNEAILKCFKEGIETSIEVIVPSPWFPEAARMLAENPAVDVGIHLALSSEWDNVKWRPLADAPSLRDEDGYFYPMIFPNKNYPNRSLRENSWKLGDVEKEFRAQIELAKKRIPRVSHVSGHMGCDAISPEVRKLARSLAKEYGLDIEPGERGVAYVG
jgi:chitin disaccharide deacetylase